MLRKKLYVNPDRLYTLKLSTHVLIFDLSRHVMQTQCRRIRNKRGQKVYESLIETFVFIICHFAASKLYNLIMSKDEFFIPCP
jgi:hypothetical protein